MRLAREQFGLRAEAEALPSERDQNFVLRRDDGRRFVLKIANPDDPKKRKLSGILAGSLLAGPKRSPVKFSLSGELGKDPRDFELVATAEKINAIQMVFI